MRRWGATAASPPKRRRALLEEVGVTRRMGRMYRNQGEIDQASVATGTTLCAGWRGTRCPGARDCARRPNPRCIAGERTAPSRPHRWATSDALLAHAHEGRSMIPPNCARRTYCRPSGEDPLTAERRDERRVAGHDAEGGVGDRGALASRGVTRAVSPNRQEERLEMQRGIRGASRMLVDVVSPVATGAYPVGKHRHAHRIGSHGLATCATISRCCRHSPRAPSREGVDATIIGSATPRSPARSDPSPAGSVALRRIRKVSPTTLLP